MLCSLIHIIYHIIPSFIRKIHCLVRSSAIIIVYSSLIAQFNLKLYKERKFIEAAESGDLESVQRFLGEELDVKAKDGSGCTALTASHADVVGSVKS